MSGAQYDAIAGQYSDGKASPLRRHIEAYSLFAMIGDVSGLQVLDLACGDGIYSRRLKQAGAARVVGVDISQGMIDLAQAAEDREPLGIEYVCEDAASMSGLGQFDLVVGAYLFHYAPNETALQAMLDAVAKHLKPGGRFVGINENPEQSLADFPGYAQYGFNKMACAPLLDASPLTYSMVSGRSMISFEVYYYTRKTYERCLAAADFRDVQWLPLSLDPAGAEQFGSEYWQEYLENPPVVGLQFTKEVAL